MFLRYNYELKTLESLWQQLKSMCSRNLKTIKGFFIDEASIIYFCGNTRYPVEEEPMSSFIITVLKKMLSLAYAKLSIRAYSVLLNKAL